MGYLDDTLIPLFHSKAPVCIVDENLFRLTLWNSSTKQCYLQRTTKYDNSWMTSSCSDLYTALLLQYAFNLHEIYIFNKSNDCDEKIKLLDKTNIDQKLFYLSNTEKSLFLSFWERIRNAIAHGGVCQHEGITIMVNQERSSPGSSVNCLLQTEVIINEIIPWLWKEFNLAIQDKSKFKEQCLLKAQNIEKRGNLLYYLEDDRYLLINDSFSYQTKGHVEEIKSLISSYEDDLSFENQRLDIIISENTNNFSIRNLSSHDGRIRVISENKIKETYKINTIHFINPNKDKVL